MEPLAETRHRDQNFYPGLRDWCVFDFVRFGFVLWGVGCALTNGGEIWVGPVVVFWAPVCRFGGGGVKPTDHPFSGFLKFFSVMFCKQSISLLHMSFGYRTGLYMAS